MQFRGVSCISKTPNIFQPTRAKVNFAGQVKNDLFGYFFKEAGKVFFLFKSFIKITLNLTFEGLLASHSFNYHDAKTF